MWRYLDILLLLGINCIRSYCQGWNPRFLTICFDVFDEVLAENDHIPTFDLTCLDIIERDWEAALLCPCPDDELLVQPIILNMLQLTETLKTV